MPGIVVKFDLSVTAFQDFTTGCTRKLDIEMVISGGCSCACLLNLSLAASSRTFNATGFRSSGCQPKLRESDKLQLQIGAGYCLG
jgi:hypothetical protein